MSAVHNCMPKNASITVLLLLTTFSLAAQSVPDSVLPPTLGALRLVTERSGKDAKGLIDRLHDRSVTPVKSYVGYYASGEGEATLYVSVYRDQSEATTVMRKMAARIKAGSPLFTRYQERTVSGQKLSGCYGLDQAHYFFSRGNRLYWLSADSKVAQRSLQSLLGKLINRP